jgi:peptide deformylase
VIDMLKTLDDLLVLGDERLYQTCEEVTEKDLDDLPFWVSDLDNVMKEIRKKYNFGRAIAAPQLGIMKRLIYMNIDKPIVFINPEIHLLSDEKFEVWDDCMSFPNLFVKVLRYRHINIHYKNEYWEDQKWQISDDLAELLQHEVDHLDGILCTMRAIDEKSYRWRVI